MNDHELNRTLPRTSRLRHLVCALPLFQGFSASFAALALAAVLTPESAANILTFQQGVNGYTGLTYATLQLGAADTPMGGSSATAWTVDGGNSALFDATKQGLIRFDNIFGSGAGQIPLGSTITSATITANFDDQSGSTFAVNRMLVSWSATSTWNSMVTGVANDGVEAVVADSATVANPNGGALGTYNPFGTALTADVQLFSNGTANYGWLVRPTAGVSGWGWTASGGNPVLTVDYVPAPTVVSVWETFDSYANGTDIVTGPPSGVWAPSTGYTVIDAGGVAGSKGLSIASPIFNWKAQPFQWSTLATGTKVAMSLDFQSSTAGKFDDDRVGWTVNADSATSSANQLALQLDNVEEGGMVVYWNSTRHCAQCPGRHQEQHLVSLQRRIHQVDRDQRGDRGHAHRTGCLRQPDRHPVCRHHCGHQHVFQSARHRPLHQHLSVAVVQELYNATDGNADNAGFITTTPAGGPALPTVALSLTGSPMAEAAGVATVTATLSATSASPVTVNLAFTGTATLTSDYTRSGTSITIAAGSTSGTATLTAVQDSTTEIPNETVIVDIDTVTGATESGVQQVTATITDDDPPPAGTVTLLTQNFDTDPVNYTLTGAQAAVTSYFALSNAAGITLNGNLSSASGVYFTMQAAATNPCTLTLNPVSLAGFTAPTLSISLAGAAAVEDDNFLRAVLDTDGDGTYETTLFDFKGTTGISNTAYNDKGTLALGDLSAAFKTFTGIPLPAGDGTLRLRIETWSNSTTNENNGFDSILISGQASGPQAPTVAITSPANGATGVSTSPDLTVSVSDPNGDPMTVTFYGRANSTPAPGPDFTIIALPDTQFYSSTYPATFQAQTNWIVNNRVARNIVYLTGEGDVVNSATDAEYVNADAAYDLLENPITTGLPQGIPFGVPVGNHDSPPYTLFNTYFGTSRFSGKSFYGGSYSTGYQNHYDLFSASGMDFIVLSLEYNAGANSAIMTWANGVLAANASRRAIVVTHSLLQAGTAWPSPAPWSADGGTTIFPALSANPNLFLMLCGHNHGTGRRHELVGSRYIDVLLADYQSDANGGDGYLRTMEFSPANNVIRVKTYSPTTSGSKIDGDNQFELSYTMAAAPPAFTVIGTQTGVASGQTSVSWPGLTTGTTYEWYATASDGTNLTTGTTNTFTTAGVPPTPPTVTLGLSSSPLAEAAGMATVTATLSASYTSDVTVNLAFSGTATQTTDYSASATSIVIAAGNTTGTVTLTAVQDSLYENPNETIVVDIATVVNGTESGIQQVTATITDDDPAPVNYRSFTGTAIAENFDGLGTAGTSVTALTGWDAGHFLPAGTINQGTTGGSGISTVTDPLVVDNGSHDAEWHPDACELWHDGCGRSCAWQLRPDIERRPVPAVGHQERLGSPITSFILSYRGEEWKSANSAVQQLTVWYSDTDTTNGFVSMGSGFTFNSPNNSGGNVAIDGNAAGNFTAISGTYTPASPIAPGSTFYIRWYDINDNAIADDFLAIDDVTVTPAVRASGAVCHRHQRGWARGDIPGQDV